MLEFFFTSIHYLEQEYNAKGTLDLNAPQGRCSGRLGMSQMWLTEPELKRTCTFSTNFSPKQIFSYNMRYICNLLLAAYMFLMTGNLPFNEVIHFMVINSFLHVIKCLNFPGKQQHLDGPNTKCICQPKHMHA